MELRAASYCRTDPSPARGQELAQQQAAIAAYCQAHRLTLTAQFTDENVSGLTLRRPGLSALLDGVGKRQFDVVVAVYTDRLSRRLVDLYRVQKTLREHGAALALCQDDRDSAFRDETGSLSEYAPPK